MGWSFYLALKQLFPTGKRVPFFSLMAVIGVMLGVMVLVIVLTVMNGFGHQIRNVINRFSGDIIITSPGSIIYNWESLERDLKTHAFVKKAAPFATGMLMLNSGKQPAFPMVKGIEVGFEEQVVPLNDFIIQGNLEDLDDESIIISSGLARNLKASIGSVLEVYTPLMLERMKEDEILLPRELDVVGIFETSWNKIDANFVLVTLRLMQELYGMGDGVHGITLKIDPNMNEDKATAAIGKDLESGLKASNWQDVDEGLLFALKLEKTTMFFIILFVILVASFSIASSLMTNVVRKTREIGLLGALGGSGFQIAACFCYQGFIIGVVGTFLGVVGGVIAIYFRNNIVHTLARFLTDDTFLLKYYQFADVPAHYLLSDIATIIVSAILIATLAGLVPAIRAARLKPSEALRSE